MDLMKVIHNNVASYMVYKNGVPCRSQKYVAPVGKYYILSPGTQVHSCLNNSYDVSEKTRITFTMIPGDDYDNIGWFWVGNPGSNDPGEMDDGKDFRTLCYDNNSYMDMGWERHQLSYNFGSHPTTKVTVEMYNYGVNVYDADGELISNDEWTPLETFESVHVFVRALQNFKLYSVKIEDDVQGVILDAHCTAAGLIDSVSGNNITPSGWTVGEDE